MKLKNESFESIRREKLVGSESVSFSVNVNGSKAVMSVSFIGYDRKGTGVCRMIVKIGKSSWFFARKSINSQSATNEIFNEVFGDDIHLCGKEFTPMTLLFKVAEFYSSNDYFTYIENSVPSHVEYTGCKGTPIVIN